ncbi:Unknown protein sequence [Pseudomonas savastanoi pv. glycinea]|nr:Unknown protein sequence [Pseudomonas savastanoi pv. glycinea]
MGFLSQLYRYRQREQRSPLEDYLTEALAEWLNGCCKLRWLESYRQSSIRCSSSIRLHRLLPKIYARSGGKLNTSLAMKARLASDPI